MAPVALVAVVGVLVAFQFQQGGVPYGRLTSRFDSGPWWGREATAEQRRLLDDLAGDLQAQSRPDDALLIFCEGCGYYL